jgi:hypothetical protein
MSSFFKKFARGTSSSTRRPTNETKPLPAPKDEPRPERTATKPKAAEEQEQEADEAIDSKLVKPEPAVRTMRIKETPKAVEGQETSGHKTTTQADIDAENIYHLVWREEESYQLIPERNPRVNEYTPNALALFKLLEAAEDRVNYSKHIQVHEQNYIPYAVKVYYAIMFYMQVLEARKTAGDASGFEMSLLKRFHAKYSRDSLPCAEIVYAYFNTVAATELADVKYDWIAPRVAPGMFHADMHSTDPDNGSIYLQPQVPHMMAILNSFIRKTNIQGSMVNGEEFEPVPLTDATHNITTFGFTFHDNAAGEEDNKCIFAANGVSTPFRFGNGNYPQAQNFARRSDFARQVSVTVATTGLDRVGQAATDTINMASLDQFLFMEKTSNLKWFGFLREQAVIHARFFDNVYHFSDVQSACGLETTLLCRLKHNTVSATANVGYYMDSAQVGIDNHAVQWYKDNFVDVTGGYATNRSGIKRNEELQALCYATNASLPIRTAANVEPLATLTENEGQLWANKEWIKSLYWQHTQPGKPMFTGLNSVVLRCFREKPHGTGIIDNEHA